MNDLGRGHPNNDDWDQHWDDYADSAERNPASLYRRRLICESLGSPGPGARIIDIGCGQGDLAAELAAQYPQADVVGVDGSQSGIERAVRKAPRARFFHRDLMDGSHPPDELRAWATHAVCSEVLEHVDDPAGLLRGATALLAPGCRLVVTVPGGPMSAFDRHIGHRTHYRRSTLASVVEGGGLVLERVHRAGWPFFNVYRGLVVARGQRLVAEVSAGSGSNSLGARVGMAAFRTLFRLNTTDSPWGWQLLAIARFAG